MVKRRSSQMFDSPGTYQIVVQGDMDTSMADQVADMTILGAQQGVEHGVTVLVGQLADQAALRGVLDTLYNQGFVVLTVNRLDG
ncbi:MAG: hypothetical protein U0822_02465 [Anaerolineae bacterium]